MRAEKESNILFESHKQGDDLDVEKVTPPPREALSPLETGQIPENFYTEQVTYETRILQAPAERLGNFLNDHKSKLQTQEERLKSTENEFDSFIERIHSNYKIDRLDEERTKLEAQLEQSQTKQEKIDHIRHKNGAFDFRLLNIVPSDELDLYEGVNSPLSRLISRKHWIEQLSEHGENYLYKLEQEIQELKKQLKSLNQAKASTNELKEIEDELKYLFDNPDLLKVNEAIHNLQERQQLERQKYLDSLENAQNEPEATYYIRPLSDSILKDIVDHLRSFSTHLEERQKLVDNFPHELETVLNDLGDYLTKAIEQNDFVSDAFPEHNYRSVFSQAQELAESMASDKAAEVKGSIAKGIETLDSLIIKFEEKRVERDKFRKERAKDRSIIRELLVHKDLTSDQQDELARLIEKYPMQGADYMPTQEYLDQIRHYSHGLAFHSSSLFAKRLQSGNRDIYSSEEGDINFWGAFQTEAIIPFYALSAREEETTRNAAGSASTHFSINRVSGGYSGVSGSTNVDIVAIAPIEVLKKSGQLYSQGFDRVNSTSNSGDQEVTGFFTTENENFEHLSYELSLTKFILLLPENSWIDPSSRKSGFYEGNNLPQGAMPTREFFERLNGFRARAGKPELKVVFSNLGNAESFQGDRTTLLAYNWLKQENLCNEEVSGLPTDSLVDLHPSQAVTEEPRYSINMSKPRFGTMASHYYWRDSDPEFDHLVGLARQTMSTTVYSAS